MAENADKAHVLFLSFFAGKKHATVCLGLIISYVTNIFLGCQRRRIKSLCVHAVCMSLVDYTKINCLHSTAHYLILVIIIEFCHLLCGEPPAP